MKMIACAAALLVLVCGIACGEQSTNTAFYFVQLSDTHWGSLNGLASTRKIVELINALPVKIECVVHTGDITGDQIRKAEVVNEGLSIMSGLKVPVHYLPGNHDVLLKDPEETAAVFTNRFGPLGSATNYCGVEFLFVCSEPVVGRYKLADFDPYEWLKGRLAASPGKPVLVFVHEPPARDFHKNEFFDVWPADEIKRWSEMLNATGVKAVIAGHFHRDEFHWLGNVPVYVDSSVAGYWGRQPGFRLYEYKDGKLSYSTVYLEAKKRETP